MHVMKLSKTIPVKYFNMRLTFILKPWGIPQPQSINLPGPVWTCLPYWGHLHSPKPVIYPPCLALNMLGPAGHRPDFRSNGGSSHCPRHISRGTLHSINFCWCANSSHHLRWFVYTWVKNVAIKSPGSFFHFWLESFKEKLWKCHWDFYVK